MITGPFRFGDFRLDGSRRLLFRGGEPVALAPKALELLELLVEHRDRTLGKQELMDRLWPDIVVAENNLTVTMSALRKALGESATSPRYLQTLSRRGYRFVEDAETEAGPRSESAQPRSPQLVGRDTERALLQKHLARALAGTGRVVFVAGEPGIGKTALCDDFIASLDGRTDLLLMRGRSLEQFGSREAYLPWLEAWGTLLGGARAARTRGVLERVAPTWCREFPGAFPPSSKPQREPGEANGQRMLREMAEALAALAAEAPLVLVLEDLHWADVASCDLLRLIAQRSQDHRWLVVGTLRGVEAELFNSPLESLRREALSHRECAEIRLGPLGLAHVAEHLHQRFAPNDFPEQLATALFRRTEGHPLFFTRLLSFLIERSDLIQRAGQWALGRPLEQLELETPEDVRAMLRRKLDSLDADAHQLLAYASVEGNEFSSRVLAALAGVAELEVEDRLHKLWSVHRLIDVLGEEEWADGQATTRYRFAHALYQNELYEGLLPRRRSELHRRAAEVLLARTEAERQRLAATLAVHLERARDFARAVQYLDLAAQNAHRLCAFAEVARHSARGLELCSHLPEPERADRACRAYLGLGWAWQNAGEHGRARATFREAVEYARANGRHEVECEALHCLSAVAWFSGEIDECRAVTEQGLAIARARGQRRHELLALTGLTGAMAGAGDFTNARRLAEEALPALEQLGDAQILACGMINLGWVGAFQSELAFAERAYARAHELWGSLGSALMCIESSNPLGWIRAKLGRPSAGLRAFEEASELARVHLQVPQWLRFAEGTGWILRALGDVSAATAHDLAGLDLARAHQVRFGELCYTIELASDLTQTGDWAVASEHLARADELVARGQFEVFPCHVRRAELLLHVARASLALARGEFDAGAAVARELLRLAALDPSREHQVLGHELLARVAAAEGQPLAARAELAQAARLLSAYPMPLIGFRVQAFAAEIHARLGEPEAASVARGQALQMIDQIAAGVESETLRACFLESPDVQVARRALECAS